MSFKPSQNDPEFKTMKTLLIVCLLAFASVVAKAQEKHAVPDKAQVEVVAALIGYELARKLPSGEIVRNFVADPAKIRGSGFLFSVLKPDELKGRIFSLHHDGFLASGDTVTLYDPDRKYKFTIFTTSLLELVDGGCSLRPLGEAVPDSELSDSQIESLEARLESRVAVTESDLKSFRLEQTKLIEKAIPEKLEDYAEYRAPLIKLLRAAKTPEEREEKYEYFRQLVDIERDIHLWEGRLEELKIRLSQLGDLKKERASARELQPSEPQN